MPAEERGRFGLTCVTRIYHRAHLARKRGRRTRERGRRTRERGRRARTRGRRATRAPRRSDAARATGRPNPSSHTTYRRVRACLPFSP
eukprot:2021018-Pleurochrysis_carterae.AAC.1